MWRRVCDRRRYRCDYPRRELGNLRLRSRARDERANLDSLAEALRRLGAKLRLEDGSTVEVPIDRVALERYELSTWRTDAGDVHVTRGIPSAKGMTDLWFYPELVAAGERVEVFGCPVVVASLAMIIDSKVTSNRDVDRQVLLHLRSLQAQIEDDAGLDS